RFALARACTLAGVQDVRRGKATVDCRRLHRFYAGCEELDNRVELRLELIQVRVRSISATDDQQSRLAYQSEVAGYNALLLAVVVNVPDPVLDSGIIQIGNGHVQQIDAGWRRLCRWNRRLRRWDRCRRYRRKSVRGRWWDRRGWHGCMGGCRWDRRRRHGRKSMGGCWWNRGERVSRCRRHGREGVGGRRRHGRKSIGGGRWHCGRRYRCERKRGRWRHGREGRYDDDCRRLLLDDDQWCAIAIRIRGQGIATIGAAAWPDNGLDFRRHGQVIRCVRNEIDRNLSGIID